MQEDEAPIPTSHRVSEWRFSEWRGIRPYPPDDHGSAFRFSWGIGAQGAVRRFFRQAWRRSPRQPRALAARAIYCQPVAKGQTDGAALVCDSLTFGVARLQITFHGTARCRRAHR